MATEMVERLRKLECIIERSPRRMTPDGTAYKALIPANLLSVLTLAADAIEAFESEEMASIRKHDAEVRDSNRRNEKEHQNGNSSL